MLLEVSGLFCVMQPRPDQLQREVPATLPSSGSMSWETASGRKTLVEEMGASPVLKVTHSGGSWQHCPGGEEGHVCAEAVGFVCCHSLLPSEFSQFESWGIFKVEGRGKVTHTPGRLSGRGTAAGQPHAGLRPMQQLHAKAVMLLLCWRDPVTWSLSPGSALIAPKVGER